MDCSFTNICMTYVDDALLEEVKQLKRVLTKSLFYNFMHVMISVKSISRFSLARLDDLISSSILSCYKTTQTILVHVQYENVLTYT